MKAKIALALSILALLAVPIGLELSQAQTQTTSTLTTEASRMDTLTTTQGEPKAVDKISSDFNSFLGTDAKAVVTGLRNGTPITLMRTTTPSTTPGTTATSTTTTTTITPPTGKMGMGNVFISLALAKQQLSQMGITQPTPQQLQAALLGGSITTGTGTNTTTSYMQGILTMRSQYHMGWGQIAHKLGFKLGPVISGLKGANQGLAAGSTSPTGSGVVSGQPAGSSEGGTVTGSGRSVGKSAKGAESGSGEGIVSGSGQPVGSNSGVTTGRGHSSGVSVGSTGGAGHGKGHSK